MRYFLMNKDEEIGSFTMSPDAESHFEQFGNRPLPVGFSYIEKWLENRKASKHNSHLRRIMAECGCDKMEGFIRLTHAASINDTFWVRSENEHSQTDAVRRAASCEAQSTALYGGFAMITKIHSDNDIGR